MILVIGSINMDLCFKVPRIPKAGETILSTGGISNPGGKGANQAVSAAKLGGEVTMLGSVGNDPHGRALLDSLKAAGVDTSHILVSAEEPSAMAFICISDAGENSIVVDSGANARVTPELIRQNAGLFDSAQYCILQLEIPLETVRAAMALCREANVRIILNPSPIRPLDDDLFRGVDYLVPNEHEVASLMGKRHEDITDGDYAAFVREKGIQNMIVTLGKEGCVLVKNGGGITRFPASAHKPVDTTGAGDTFLGALTVALSEDVPPEEAIAFATTVSGIAVTRYGAQQAMPLREEVCP